MKPKLKIEDATASVEGKLTIKYHRELLQIFSKLTAINVAKLKVEASEIDLCALQLLHALHRSTENVVQMNIEFKINDADMKLLTRCGFSYLLTSTP